MKHVMIDCESFGLKHTSAIATLGACEFDPHAIGSIGATFHEAIDLKSSLNHGLTVDAGTILWWLEQSEAARSALVSKLRAASSLSTVLTAFKNYLGSIAHPMQIKLWSCGWKDFAWLEAAYDSVKTPVPWGYRVGDYRTIRDEFMLPGDEPPATVSHDALADAIWQARLLQNILARLRQQKQDAEVYAAERYTGPSAADAREALHIAAEAGR